VEYAGQIVNGIIALIFAVISWRVKRYLDSITDREAELQSALAAKEAELHAMLAEDRKHIEEIRIANNRGTQALLRDRLLQGYHFFRRRGMVTYGEARNYENMYEAYHDLGKNGVMDTVYQKFRQIPVKDDIVVYPDENI
jgi:hypothetical protein